MFSRSAVQKRLAKDFHADLQRFRGKHGDTIADIAAACEINPHTLQGYSTGTACPPLDVFVRIFRVAPCGNTLRTLNKMCGDTVKKLSSPSSILHAVGTIGKATASVNAEVIEAFADGHMDEDEKAACLTAAKSARAEIDQLIDLLEAPMGNAMNVKRMLADTEKGVTA